MPQAKAIGEHYASLLEEQLNSAIQKRLDATSSFKKALAGISSIDDAKNKGYCPSDVQISTLKNLIKSLATTKYSHADFRKLPADHAASQLIEHLSQEVHALNQQWKNSRQFSFEHTALTDLAAEAKIMISDQHQAALKRFKK